MSKFVKRRLSKEAVDAFVLRFTTTEITKSIVPYTTASGQRVLFDFLPLLFGEEAASDEFNYLLGQTLPYHDRKSLFYPLHHLGYICDENGKPTPWTTKTEDLAAFVQLGIKSGRLITHASPVGTVFDLNSNIPAVTHTEKSHDEG